MADDQVKYSDLIVKDEDVFGALLKELGDVKTKISELKSEASGLSSVLKSLGTATRDQQQATAATAKSVEDLSQKTKELADRKKNLEDATKRFSDLTDEELGHLEELTAMLKSNGQWLSNIAKMTDTTNMSYNEMKATLTVLTSVLHSFGSEEKKNSGEAKALEGAIERVRDAMKDLDERTKAAANAKKQMAEETKKAASAEKQMAEEAKKAAKEEETAYKASQEEAAKRVKALEELHNARQKEIEDAFKAWDAEMAEAAKKAAKEEEMAYKASQEEAAKRVKTQEELHNARQKEIEDAFKARDAEMAKMKLTEEEYNSVKQLKSALAGTSQEQIAAAQAIDIESKSYNELYQTYNALKDALNAMTVAERENTAAGKEMTAQSAKIHERMNQLQQSTGKYTLQVGKYRAAFDGFGYSFQQILREVPSALNINQFFLAISNNIPMFLDQWKAFSDEQKEIKANLAQMTEGTKEYAEQLGKVESVGKKLGRTLLSWQTLVLVGLMLLRNMGKISNWLKGVFENLTAEGKQLKAVNEAAASSIGEMTAKYQALRKEWQNISSEDMNDWLEQHKDDWKELGVTIGDAKTAEDFYVNNTAAVQKAIDDRARSMAAMKLAAEKYEEAFKKQVEAERGLKQQNMGMGSRMLQSLAAAGMGESGGTLTSEQQSVLDKAAEQSAQAFFNKQMEEVRKLQEEAQSLITTFVLPGTLDSDSDSKKGGKKSTQQEVESRYWDAEKALLEAMQQGYELERSLAKLTRDKERDDQNEWYVEQRLKLDENLKKGFITQEMHNAQLLELDRQNKALREGIENAYAKNMADINAKELEEREKAAQKAAELAEKAAKDEAKARYKALTDGWQEERAQLVELGVKRKELIRAEIDAEINRLNVMLELQRSLNGERMSDEERQKIEAWIQLLNKLKESGDFSNIKLGQIFGKGGSNVNGETKNYSSVVDMLFPEMSSGQQSALNSVFDQAKAALNSWMDARKEAADQAKELADDEVSAAENALNREIELRNQGYANDVALRERELAAAKKQQKEAAAEQKKIAKEQILLDAAMQTSSMITASANIMKQFPNPAAWLPMLGVMWSAFAYAKIKAYQAADKNITFGEGGSMLLEGGSHQSGHDISLGIGPDGSHLRAEGGEYFAVFNKRNSRKYGSEIPGIVNALNAGVFEDKYIKTADAAGLPSGTVIAAGVDLSTLEGGMSQLVKQGEERWNTEGDYRVLRHKNLTRRERVR